MNTRFVKQEDDDDDDDYEEEESIVPQPTISFKRAVQYLISLLHCYHPTISTHMFYKEVLRRYLPYLRAMIAFQVVFAFAWIGIVAIINIEFVTTWRIPFIAVIINACAQLILLCAILTPCAKIPFIVFAILTLSNLVHVAVMIMFALYKPFAKNFVYSHALWIGVQIVRVVFFLC